MAALRETVSPKMSSPAVQAVQQNRRRKVRNVDDNSEAIQILKVSGPIAIFFLLSYLAIDSYTYRKASLETSPYHWLAVAGTLLFFGLMWTRGFRRHWKLWTYICCLCIIAIIIQISAINGDLETRFIAIILCPFATAAFVIWGPQWQAVLNSSCLLAFAGAEILIPIPDDYILYRWLGLFAAAALSQFTNVSLDRYRRKLRAQMDQLAEAAKFRESQIATMTHDIRNPLATLVGLVTLLEEDELTEKETGTLLGRVGSTARSMDLLVKNVLDLYLLDERGVTPNFRSIDANAVVADVGDSYAREARLKGVKLRTEFGGVPEGNLDPLHLERIVANMLNVAVRRTAVGEVRLRTALRGAWLIVDVSDTGPPVDSEQLSHLFEHPDRARNGGRPPSWGMYIAQALAQASGGRIQAKSQGDWGLSLTAVIPLRRGEPAPA
jgi:signal transduction histidine kinase